MLNTTIQAPQLISTNPDTPEPSHGTREVFRTNGVVSYDLIDDFEVADEAIQASPGWCMAVVRLDKPITYSRRYKKSIGDVVSGAYQRRSKPLIIFDDCIRLNVSRSADSSNFTKVLNSTLKSGFVNYLSANAVLPGDWIFAWCHNNIEDTKKVIKKLLDNKSANEFMDGLKFCGRVHNIRKNLVVNKTSKTVTYSLQAVGFGELDSTFYYDVELATAVLANGDNDLAKFMAQIGIDWTNFVSKQHLKGGELVDNIDAIMAAFIDIVIGAGGPKLINEPTKDIYTHYDNKGIENGALVAGGSQASIGVPRREEAPYSYLVPVTAAQILGKTVVDKSKPSVFGFSDILHLLVGVQQFNTSDVNSPSRGFWPVLESGPESRNTQNRSFCKERIKGTYDPAVEGNFLNRPLWQILQQFLNPSINNMYTALKVGPDGKIIPTVVIRQVPFSTNCIKKDPNLVLTRFLDLPRWVIDPVMVKELNVGRSDATRKNMVKIIGTPTMYAKGVGQEEGFQVTMFPPIFDTLDVARCGLKPHAQAINCSVSDILREDGINSWLEAVADWTFGSQYTLNGTIRCVGIQTPIAEGDAVEFDGIVYYIESISDNCSVSPKGTKSYETVLSLSNGMPADQSLQNGDDSEDFPLYPGFEVLDSGKEEKVQGNDLALKTNDPGFSEERDVTLNNEGV
jgi:hypothetical protein